MCVLPVGRPVWGLLVLCSLAAGLTLCGPLFADDFLDQVRREREIAAQKLEAEVTASLAEARRLESTDLARAVDVLRRCRGLLEEDRALSEERRAELLRQVQARLQPAQANLRLQQNAADRAAAQTAEKQKRQGSEGQPKVKNPVDQATDYIQGSKGKLDSASKLRAEREQGYQSAMRDIDKAGIPGSGEIQFPSNWRELAERRKAFAGPQMTAQEKALLKALNSTLSVDFKNTIFREVIDLLQERTGQTILLDKESLREAQIEYDDPVNFAAKKVTVRTILRKVLGDRGLAYILKDGVIQVVTPQKARETMVTRSYPISDLLPPTEPRFGPLVARIRMQQYATQIIEMIQTTVEPGTWQINGGPGTIVFSEPSMSLVIRQSAEMHYTLSSGGIGR